MILQTRLMILSRLSISYEFTVENFNFERDAIMRKNVINMSVEEFLREYIDFLVFRGLSENASKVYAGKLRKFLLNGYSIADLCGAVVCLIKRYGKGGDKYDPKDHGNIYNALKWLWRFLYDDVAENIYIHYRKGWSSFVPVGKHMVEYTISGNTIEVKYNAGFGPGGVKTKTIKTTDLCMLIDIMKRHRARLANSNSTVNTFHDVIYQYDYRFDGREEIECGYLFDDDSAMAEYQAWLAPFVK